ncbi:MAG: SUMF1/EgtB/PvdO family nonheme iron enzyme [Myxococcales bacterium]|nr:SUMF1/EgtB/PvdO family nonheme iron enzyme [Myxococcales bacterium]
MRSTLVAASVAMLSSSCEPATDVQARVATPVAEPAIVQAAAPAAPAPPGPEQPPAPPPPLGAGQMVAFAAGPLVAGSLPGQVARDPATEADAVALQLGAFEIDRLPFPNDPAKPAQRGVSRLEAAQACEAAGKRLCSELEWERACRGRSGRDHALGQACSDDRRARCRSEAASCQTAEGVADLGITAREWTASTVAGGLGHPQRNAVLRGGPPGETLPERCAARTGATGDSRSQDLGFRCCRGAEQSPDYPSEGERPLTRPLSLKPDKARAVLASIPALEPYAASFELHSRADADAALRRGGRSRGSMRFWQVLPAAFAWSPVHGEELWVLSGRSGKAHLLILVHALPDGRFSHAASTRFEDEEASVVLGINADHPRQLMWATCFDCPTKGGVIDFGDDGRANFEYR